MVAAIYIIGLLCAWGYAWFILGGFDTTVGWAGIFWPFLVVAWVMFSIRKKIHPDAPDFWSIFDGC